MPVSFTKKASQQESIWEKRDPSKPFETCTDLTKLPKNVLDALEKQGYDENDETKQYDVLVDGYNYRFKVWNGDWQCSRWPKKAPGSGGFGGRSMGPREWSYNKMVDFEFGNLNQLHDIFMNEQLDEDETWELVPFIVMNSKNEPHGVMKKLKRIPMIGSEEKDQNGNSQTDSGKKEEGS
jgi:hypothetical protein